MRDEAERVALETPRYDPDFVGFCRFGRTVRGLLSREEALVLLKAEFDALRGHMSDHTGYAAKQRGRPSCLVHSRRVAAPTTRMA